MPGEGAEFLPRHYIGKFDLHQRAYAMFNFSDLVDPKYLYFYLISVKDFFANNAVGATVKSLRRRHFTHLEVPLPSLEKQRKIVEKLDSAFTEIDLLEGNLNLRDERANELLKSILGAEFKPTVDEGESENTSTFQENTIKVLPFGEVCTLEYGKPLDKEFRKIDAAYKAYGANGPISSSTKYLIDGPCIIVGRKGSAGEITYVTENVWPLDVTYYVKHDPKKSDLKYLFYTLKSLDIKQFVRGVKPGLNRNDVYVLPILLPSIENQRQIVEKLYASFAEIELLKAQIRAEKDYAFALRQSLLSSAFTQEEAVA